MARRWSASKYSAPRAPAKSTSRKGARAAIAELQKEHANIVLKEVIDNAFPVEENFKGSMELLYEGALLAVLVVWWFLRDWRATLVAAAALPLSVIPAFLGQYLFGYTLNTVTLLSLALVVGVLVDDAIVEIENISRHLKMGKTPMQASLEAADEIGMAVIATTFALVAVFLPTAFMGGIPGKFFKQFGWTAVLAILASLLVARLLTPMMAAYILKPTSHREEKDGWIMTRYMAAMKWCLNHRWITAFGAGVFFVGSIGLVFLLPTGFVPPADRAQTQINLELPPGSTLAETRVVAEQARLAAMQVKGIKGVFSSIGGGSSGDAFAPGAAAEARRAILTLTTVHRNDRKESLECDRTPDPRQARSDSRRALQCRPARHRRQDAAGAAQRRPGRAERLGAAGRTRTAHAQRRRQRQFERLAGAPRNHRAARLCQGGRPRRDGGFDRRDGAAWPPPATTTPR